MSGKEYNFPVGMIVKKFYCHKCGERLLKSPYTRFIHSSNPEYDNYLGGTHITGPIEKTQYNFKCSECYHSISYNKQLVISEIQRKLNKKRLTEEEIKNNIDLAKKKKLKKDKIGEITWFVFCFIITILLIYFYTR